MFHDSDKVTSLFVHIYAPLVFTVIRCVFLQVQSFLSDRNFVGTSIPMQRPVSLRSPKYLISNP